MGRHLWQRGVYCYAKLATRIKLKISQCCPLMKNDISNEKKNIKQQGKKGASRTMHGSQARVKAKAAAVQRDPSIPPPQVPTAPNRVVQC